MAEPFPQKGFKTTSKAIHEHQQYPLVRSRAFPKGKRITSGAILFVFIPAATPIAAPHIVNVQALLARHSVKLMRFRNRRGLAFEGILGKYGFSE